MAFAYTPKAGRFISVLMAASIGGSAGSLAQSSAPNRESGQSNALVVGQVVDGDTGQGIGSVIVTISTDSPTGPNETPPLARSVLTDGSGMFYFADMPPLQYRIAALKSGYLAGAYGRVSPGGSSGMLGLSVAERAGPVKIEMWKPAVLAGTVTDEAGEPVVDVEVDALERAYIAGRARFKTDAVVHTDDRGAFRFSLLTSGDYVICVPAVQSSLPTSVIDDYIHGTLSASTRSQLSVLQPALDQADSADTQRFGDVVWQVRGKGPVPPPSQQGVNYAYTTTFYPSAIRLDDAELVSLRSGEQRQDLELRIMPVSTHSLEGSVVDVNGPVPSVIVRLEGDNAKAYATITGFESAKTLTDASGRFAFLGVPSGHYQIEADKRETAFVPPETATPVIQLGSSVVPTGARRTAHATRVTRLEWGQLDVDLEGANVSGLTVPMSPGLTVSGRVQFAGIGQTDLDPQLVDKLMIDLEPADGRPRMIPAVTPNDDGSFSLGSAEPGQYFVRVKTTLKNWFLEGAIFNGVDVSDRPLAVASGDSAGVIVTMTNHPTRLAGTVLQSDGSPDQTATVAVFPQDQNYWLDFGWAPRRLRTVRTDAHGTFEVLGLPIGSYSVAAYDPTVEWRDISEMFEVLSKFGKTVEVSEGHATPLSLVALSKK